MVKIVSNFCHTILFIVIVVFFPLSLVCNVVISFLHLLTIDIHLSTSTFVIDWSPGISHMNPEICSMLYALDNNATLVPRPVIFLVRIFVLNIRPDQYSSFLGCNLDGWREA